MSERDDKVTRVGVAIERAERALNAYARVGDESDREVLQRAIAGISEAVQDLLGPEPPPPPPQPK